MPSPNETSCCALADAVVHVDTWPDIRSDSGLHLASNAFAQNGRDLSRSRAPLRQPGRRKARRKVAATSRPTMNKGLALLVGGSLEEAQDVGRLLVRPETHDPPGQKGVAFRWMLRHSYLPHHLNNSAMIQSGPTA